MTPVDTGATYVVRQGVEESDRRKRERGLEGYENSRESRGRGTGWAVTECQCDGGLFDFVGRPGREGKKRKGKQKCITLAHDTRSHVAR